MRLMLSPESPRDSSSPIILYIALIFIEVLALISSAETALRNVAISYSILSEISSYFTSFPRSSSNFSGLVSLMAALAYPSPFLEMLAKCITSLKACSAESSGVARCPASMYLSLNGFSSLLSFSLTSLVTILAIRPVNQIRISVFMVLKSVWSIERP